MHQRANSSSHQTENQNKKGMILPFEPHSISFNDVIYSVDMPQVSYKQLTLLEF